MSPCELKYSLNGKVQKAITGQDGILTILETPAGTAMAKLEPNGHTWLTRQAVIDRLGVLFPGDPQSIRYATSTNGLHYHINTIFDYFIPKERKLMKLKEISRRKTIQTQQGEVKIEARGYDNLSSNEPTK